MCGPRDARLATLSLGGALRGRRGAGRHVPTPTRTGACPWSPAAQAGVAVRSTWDGNARTCHPRRVTRVRAATSAETRSARVPLPVDFTVAHLGRGRGAKEGRGFTGDAQRLPPFPLPRPGADFSPRHFRDSLSDEPSTSLPARPSVEKILG